MLKLSQRVSQYHEQIASVHASTITPGTGHLAYQAEIKLEDLDLQVADISRVSVKAGGPTEEATSLSADLLPPPQPLTTEEEAINAAELAASRSQAAALKQELLAAKQDLAAAAAARSAAEISVMDTSSRLSEIQNLSKQLAEDVQNMKKERQATREREERLCKQLQDAQAELASQAGAGNAELIARIAILEEDSTKIEARAHDELVACRDAGMKVKPRSLIASLDSTPSELHLRCNDIAVGKAGFEAVHRCFYPSDERCDEKTVSYARLRAYG